MPLTLQSRRVGDITVVTCSGRLIEGSECAALQQHLDLAHEPCVVLNLGDVGFLDSSGLGLLVRLLTRSRAAGGDIKLCAVSARIGEVLRITRLERLFDTHGSEADAIGAFYQHGASAAATRSSRHEILCVGRSADVQTYVRELLGHAGYAVMTVGNLRDAATLVKATRPRLIVIAADVSQAGSMRAADTFRTIDPALPIIELEADFSGHEAGEAAERLLDRIRTTLGERGGLSTPG